MATNHQTTDCDAIRDLIPEYVFGLTTPAEQQRIEASLADCPEAGAALDDYLRLQDAMRADVPQIEPPADLMDRILIAATPARTPLQIVPSTAPTVVPRRLNWRIVAAAAAVLLVASNLFWALRLNDVSRQRDALRSQVAQLIDAGSGSSPAFIASNVMALRWVRLPPAQQGVNTAAFMMWNAESKTGLLYASNFPTLAAGKTYQLWLRRDGERTSVGLFTVDAQGRGALLFRSEDPIDQFVWAWITVEPENGSITPSKEVVVTGALET